MCRRQNRYLRTCLLHGRHDRNVYAYVRRHTRTPEQIATARAFLGEGGEGSVVAFDEDLAATAADVFRQLGSPRRRAADVAIGVTAAARRATLISRNVRDFSGMPGLVVEEAAGG